MGAKNTSKHLLHLPGEIRNLIYEYALIHHKNKGVIAPIMTKNDDIHLAMRPELDTIVNGERRRVLCRQDIANLAKFALPSLLPTGRYEFDHLTHLANGGSKDDICGFLMERNEITGTVEITKPFIAHLCTTQCLLQPAITRVSRRIREEALPVVCGVNEFYLDLVRQYSGSRATTTAIIAWWRAIEDTNLRMIKKLYIKDKNVFGLALKLTWRSQTNLKKLTVDLSDPDDSDTAYLEQEASEAFEQIEEGGIFVRGIERILSVSGVFGKHRGVAW